MKTKMSAADRMARIKRINEQLKKENDLFKQYGVDANLGIDEEMLGAAEQAKADDAATEAVDRMPELGRKVGLALSPVTDPNYQSDFELLGAKYGDRLKSKLTPKLHKAVSIVFPRKRA